MEWQIKTFNSNKEGCYKNPNSMLNFPSERSSLEDVENIDVLYCVRPWSWVRTIHEYRTFRSSIPRSRLGEKFCHLPKIIPLNPTYIFTRYIYHNIRFQRVLQACGQHNKATSVASSWPVRSPIINWSIVEGSIIPMDSFTSVCCSPPGTFTFYIYWIC